MIYIYRFVCILSYPILKTGAPLPRSPFAGLHGRRDLVLGEVRLEHLGTGRSEIPETMVDVGKISGILGYYWNMSIIFTGIISGILGYDWNTLGGRNPAPVENGTVNIPLFI